MDFIVEYSEEKDIQIYLDAIWKPIWTDYGKTKYEIGQKYLPLEFLDNLKNSNDKDDAIKVIKDYWQKTRVPNFQQNTDLTIKWFSKFLNEEQELIIERLEKAYDKPFPFDKITVYITSFFSCPYNYKDKWYMIGRGYNLLGLLNTSTHELNHFMFYYYFANNLKKQNFNDKQIEYLKEALAIVTTNNIEENKEKINVLPIQNFVKEIKSKPVSEIIELVIKNKLLNNIK